MNMVSVFLKRTLSLAGAVVLMAIMTPAVSPAQMMSIDEQIKALTGEIAQLKQAPTDSQRLAGLTQALDLLKRDLGKLTKEQQEERLQALRQGIDQLSASRLNAVQHGLAQQPSFKYAAGKGLTIAAADNNWSITFGQRLQLYTSLWLSNDAPDAGYPNGEIRIRRFRPNINVTSQQGFYEVKWTFSGKSTVAFDGDGYLHFEKLNPWLPTVGYGYNPSFSGNQQQGAFRTEDSPLVNALAMGASQDGSIVLSWKTLPPMGMSKITHFELALGQDEQDEYGQGSNDGRSTAFALGLQPLANAQGMGGFDVSSLTYSFGYESMTDLKEGPGAIYGATTQHQVDLVSASAYGDVGPDTYAIAQKADPVKGHAAGDIVMTPGKGTGQVTGDHTYMSHGLAWSPLTWLQFSANYVTYEADGDKGIDIEVSEVRLAANLWLWGPKSGMMGGSKAEGGISISPLYTVADFDTMSAEVSNSGLAVVYNAPGGWMQIHGVWDRLGCEGTDCATPFAVAEAGDDSFNVFTLMAEYRF